MGCQSKLEVSVLPIEEEAPFLSVAPDSLSKVVGELSLEEKLGQLIFHDRKGIPDEALLHSVRMGLVGGIQFSGVTPSEYLLWRDSLRRISPRPLLIGLKGEGGFHEAFTPHTVLPQWEAWESLANEELRQFGHQTILDQWERLRPDWVYLPKDGAPTFIEDCHRLGLLPIAKAERMIDFVHSDSSQQLKVTAQYASYAKQGIAGVLISTDRANADQLAVEYQLIRQKAQYGGLIIAAMGDQPLDTVLSLQPDLLLTTATPRNMAERLLQFFDGHPEKEAWLNGQVLRLLQAKQWLYEQRAEQPIPTIPVKTLDASFVISSPDLEQDTQRLSLEDYYTDERWGYWVRQVAAQSLVLAANPDSQIPIAAIPQEPSQIFHLGNHEAEMFDQYWDKYAAYRSWTLQDWGALEPLVIRSKITAPKVIVLHDFRLDSTQAQQILSWSSGDQPLILVNMGQADNLTLLDTSLVVVQAFDGGATTQALLPQLLFGGVPATGQLPRYFSEYFPAGQGFTTLSTRIRYGLPQEQGIAPQSLVGIDAITQTAIDDKIFPGAQVTVVKSGTVIYEKAFGHHTYDEEQAVELSDVYDLASVSKVAATALVAMQQYETGAYQLKRPIKEYLSLSRHSPLRYLTPQKLLTHRTGLQAHLPVVPYLLSRDSGNIDCTNFFCTQSSDSFSIQGADNFYFSKWHYDQMWKDLQRLKPRRTSFKYSDANFVLLQQLLEAKGGESLDELVYQHFYTPLGLRRTWYQPLSQLPIASIVPTQQDDRWRHQLLRGYVHDETAALMGGVAGHAGLFSNASDLAVIFQLLLNGGSYGAQTYLEPSTIDYFTAARHGNHRGLAFDKPKEKDVKEGRFPRGTSTRLYGHTGFTGTCVWVDPDQELIYIFLSNRIHPSAKNRALFQKRVRERIHQVVYDALNTLEVGMPRLG